MAKATTKLNGQVNKVVDQINKNVDGIFGLLTTITGEVEKLANAGIAEIDTAVQVHQKIGKELVAPAAKIANQAVQATRKAVDGTHNLYKAKPAKAA